MVNPWKWFLFLGHLILPGSGWAACQGIAGRAAGDSTFWVLRQLWPPSRPGLGSSEVLPRRRLPRAALTVATEEGRGTRGEEAVAYQDLLALLSVAFQGQQQVIQKQRNRMDQLLAEFADIKKEIEQDSELQELYAEVRKQRAEKVAKKASKKKSKKKTKAKDASDLTRGKSPKKNRGSDHTLGAFDPEL
eukprot:TRINITY_DN22706_c0_g1_i1.p2 TRINITY_DN22706_c0_g1~~TRINITY_DN22706_c0_g1_i1.p2  ORF type:complete len:190 (-),score=52.86 TRINITY_DN22706_c0_g1_i1:180-749(-)